MTRRLISIGIKSTKSQAPKHKPRRLAFEIWIISALGICLSFDAGNLKSASALQPRQIRQRTRLGLVEDWRRRDLQRHLLIEQRIKQALRKLIAVDGRIARRLGHVLFFGAAKDAHKVSIGGAE